MAALVLRALPVHATSWRPASVSPLLNLALDASLVEDSPGGPLRFDAKSLLVLDGLVDEPLRRDLLEMITEKGWEDSRPGGGGGGGEAVVTGDAWDGTRRRRRRRRSSSSGGGGGGGGDSTNSSGSGTDENENEGEDEDDGRPEEAEAEAGTAAAIPVPPEPGLPPSLWERETRDQADLAPTWGLRPHVLASLLQDPPPPLREVHSRLALLYPSALIAPLPSRGIQAGPRYGRPDVDACALLANAAVEGDDFRWCVPLKPRLAGWLLLLLLLLLLLPLPARQPAAAVSEREGGFGSGLSLGTCTRDHLLPSLPFPALPIPLSGTWTLTRPPLRPRAPTPTPSGNT